MVASLKKRISDLEDAEKERDKALDSLRLSERMFSKILTFSPDSIIISSMADGRYINVNDSFLDAVGFKREDLIGKTSIALNIWDDPEEREKFLQTLHTKGFVQNFEAKFRKKNGCVGTVLMSSEKMDIDGEPCLITLSKDITDRKRAEIALKDSEQRLRTIFETSPDAIIITAMNDDEILEFNQVFLDISGYRRDEIESGKVRLTERLLDQREHHVFRQRLQKNGFVSNLEFQFSRCDGIVKTGLISARLVTINNSACVLSIIKDIDDLKKVRLELERQKSELAESKKKIEELSVQTVQFSLAAASMITMKDEEEFFVKISKAIVEYSDFNRVLIFYFKDSFPYRDIIGSEGFSEEEIKTISGLEARKDWFSGVIEKGLRIGKFSYHIKHESLLEDYPGLRMPGIAPCNSLPEGWGKDDCLLVRLTDQKGKQTGFICVDGSKSGLEPTDDTVRPLEIFASLIAQIIISRKIHEERIKSEIRYRTILEKIDDPYFELDLQGNYVFYNTALNNTLGYSDLELLNSSIKNHLSERNSEAVYSEIISLTSTRTMQYEIVKKSGDCIPVETHFSIIEDSDGAPVGLRGISRDISMHKQVESELKKAKNTAEATGRAQRSFLANISHEIRTPLSGVIGMCKLMMDTKLTEEQKEYISSLNESADFLMNVINDVLDFSKLQAGQFTLEKMELSLFEAVHKAVLILKNQAMQKGLDIRISISQDVPEKVYGDAGRIGQILVNLIGNAIKFTEKGHIEICVALSEETDDDLLLKFKVIDTGIGIPFEKMNKLFRPFSQVDGSLTRHYRGTGLGLVISRQLVELMGGAIGVKNNSGSGSVFWFTVRVGRISGQAKSLGDNYKVIKSDSFVPEAPVPESKKVVQAENGVNKKILIVEDNEINQLLIRKFMDKLGFSSKTAKNGREAVEFLSKDDFDVVLMDLQMPEMSGIDATRVIRDRNSKVKRHDIPIIAVTAHAMKEDRDRCLEVGMNDYISKPITLQAISDVINRLMV